MGRLISYQCADEDVLAYLDGLPEGTSISEEVRKIMRAYVRGELVPPGSGEDMARVKLEGAHLDNDIKRAKLDNIRPLAELKKEQLRADITLKQSQLKLSDAALAKLTAPRHREQYRYMLHSPKSQDIMFVCPHCGRTIGTTRSYQIDSYLPMKQRLVAHLADAHGIEAPHFDRYTFYYFKNFELHFFGREYPACPQFEGFVADEFATPRPLPKPEAE